MVTMASKIIFSILILCLSINVHAYSLSFSAVIKTESPKVQVVSTENPVAHVKQFEALIDKEAGICELTPDPAVAQSGLKKGERWYCLVEWLQHDDGLQISEFKKTGLLSTDGSIQIPYRVTVFSNGSEVELFRAVHAVDVLAATEPVISEVLTSWRDDERTGLEHSIFSPKETHRSVRVNVLPQQYDQVATLDEHICVIEQGASSCNIDLGDIKYGNSSDNKSGSVNYGFSVTDSFGYFNNLQNSQYSVEWDYREPIIESFHYNAETNDAVKTVSVGDEIVLVARDEAILIVDTPHMSRDGDWWIPKSLPLNLTTVDGFRHSDTKEIDGSTIRFEVPNYLYRSNHAIKLSKSPEKIGGKLVYKYSLADLPDGKYDLTVSASDEFENSTEKSFKSNLIDRFPPDIKFVMGGKVIGDGAEVYFTTDIKVATNGGWSDGSQITGVSVNGKPISHTGDSEDIQQLLEAADLIPNNNYEIVAHAEDAAGNVTSKSLNMSYMPVEFDLYGLPDRLFAKSQTAKVYVTQKRKGQRCSMASSAEVATVFSRVFKKGCTVEWPELPSGMESVYTGSTYAVEGAIDEVGTKTLKYRVRYYNSDGTSVIAYEGQKQVNVVPAEAIGLELDKKNFIADGIYGVDFNSRIVASYELTTTPADTIVSIKLEGGEQQQHQHDQRKRIGSYSIKRPIYRNDFENAKVWDASKYSVNAAHVRDSESNVSTQFNVVVLPDRATKVYLDTENTQATSIDLVHAKVMVGKVSRADGLEYDLDSMGEWNVFLAYKDGGDYIPLTDKVKLPNTGIYEFQIDASKLYDVSTSYYAIAEVISSGINYQKVLTSTPAFIRVLKGTAVEGGIFARRVRGRIPMSLDVRYEHKTADDRRVSGEIQWETSRDGVVWTELPEFAGKRNIKLKLLEADNSFIRASVENKLTKVQSKTEAIEVIAYDVASIQLAGPIKAYVGQTVDFELELSDSYADDAISDIEWSVDNGNSWSAGGRNRSFVFTESTSVQARLKLASTDSRILDDGWAVARKDISVVEPKPITVSSSMPRIVEVGKTISLSGSARNSYSGLNVEIVSEWISPSGITMSGSNTEYVVEPEDIVDGDSGEFIFRAWVKGYQAETLAERRTKAKVWKYELPNTLLTLSSDIKVAPSKVTARVAMPYVYAPGVEFNFEWVIDESRIRIDGLRDKSATLYAIEPGLHQIKVIFSDNRGNRREMVEFVDLVEAEPMQANFTVTPSNEFWRVPVSIGLKGSSDPGHPKDYPSQYHWSINDDLLIGEDSSFVRHVISEPGDYRLKMEATSKMGQSLVVTKDITVVPNQPPICEPEIKESESHITVVANCTDVDGRVVAIKYSWNGGPEASGGTSLTFSKALYEYVMLTVRAIDDSGQNLITTVDWKK